MKILHNNKNRCPEQQNRFLLRSLSCCHGMTNLQLKKSKSGTAYLHYAAKRMSPMLAKISSFSFTFLSFFSFFLTRLRQQRLQNILNCIQKKGSDHQLVFRFHVIIVGWNNTTCSFIWYLRHIFFFALRCNLTKIGKRIPTQRLNCRSWHEQKPWTIKNKKQKLHIAGTSDFLMAVPKFTVVIVVWTLAGWIQAQEGIECVSGGFVLIWSHCVGSLWSSRGGLWVVCPGGW